VSNGNRKYSNSTMTKRIDQFVSENRESVKRLDSTFIPISGQRSSNYTFSGNQFEIVTSVRVYTRDLNESLISGHPNGSRHGSGQGDSGDFRGSWTLVEDVENSEKFVTDGRNIVAEGLAGQSEAVIGKISVGSGTTDATINDSSLETPSATTFAYPNPGDSSNESTAEGIFLFQEYGDTFSEFGAKSRAGDLYNRITTDTLNPSNEKELRVEIDFEVTNDTTGTSVITDVGQNRVADSLRALDTAIGLNSIAFGTGTTEPTASDTALENEVFEKNAQRLLSSETVTANMVVFQQQPSSQPHDISEIGVFDSSGNMLWRATVDPFEKTSNVEFTTNVSFRIR